jgi:hypothetical protein
MIRDQPWITWIKWLPIELRLTIYDFIDIETRLEILAPLITDTIRYLYRSTDTITLLHKYEQLIYMRLFTKSDDGYSTKPAFNQLLPPTMYLKSGVQCLHTHPVISMLKQDLQFSSFSKRMIISLEQTQHRNYMYRYHNDIVGKIQHCCNLIPSVTSFNPDFDYQLKRLLIRFLHHLTKITDVIKKEDREREILLYERNIRRYYSKRVLTRIRIQSNKMQQRIAKTAKLAEKNAKRAEKNAKRAAKLSINIGN